MKLFHVLCFGDSLTAGFSFYGSIFHPYAWNMKSWFEAAMPSITVIADVEGLSGDLAISPPGTFYPRIEDRFENLEIAYDWVVVLGGTNDLGRGYKASQIYPALQRVWNTALNHGAKVLALTVIECGVCDPRLDERRDALNKMIKEHKAEGYYTLDLHAKIPYFSMPEARRKEIWDDGVHFTPEGYDLMGSIIANRLMELELKLKHGVNDTNEKTVPKVVVAEEKFEEEKEGRLLSQSHVAVSKEDVWEGKDEEL
jgi:lysophospholipase L1-like esterase